MAICRVAPTAARPPCLVALLPQQEVVFDSGGQVGVLSSMGGALLES